MLLARLTRNLVADPRTDGTASAQPGRRTFRPWTPDDRYIFSLDHADTLVREGAEVQAALRHVSASHCLRAFLGPDGRPAGGDLRADLLAPLELKDRLDVHAHGQEDELAHMGAAQFAAFLQSQGLRRVGLLKLQACLLGKERFLEDLLQSLAQRGIEVGYLCAPVGNLMDLRKVVKIGTTRFVTLAVGPAMLANPMAWPKMFAPKRVDRQTERRGLAVLKGNVDIAFAGTRYDLPDEPAAE